jgi:hypothetical protein
MIIETLEGISVLINIGTSLIELKKKLFNSNRRKEIAEWVYELGKLVDDLAEYFKRKEYPNQTCSRMQYLYTVFDDIVRDAITQREEENLKELIFKTINIEKTYGEFINLEEFDQSTYIQELYSISGSILGIADFLKYKK